MASQPLKDLKVVDCATLLAGPLIATLLADYGADVVKVEHPKGDALRGFGWVKDGVSLWWLFVNRNKACVSLDLGRPEGAAVLKELVADADVLIENFRPGTMERWGLGWEDLSAVNPRLVMVRVTGFGQTGPYSGRPGYGTLAESMSGFAHLNGYPDGPPTLPPLAVAERVMRLVGRDDLVSRDWFADHRGRLMHQDEVEDAIADWVAKRSSAEVTAAFEAVGAAIAPMYSIADIMSDPHYAHRDTIP